MDEFGSGNEKKALHEARLWKDNGWTAQVIKNEEDDGWAVAMTCLLYTTPSPRD